MANKDTNKEKQTVINPVAPEAVYTHDEIMASASSFGVQVELLAGALKLSEKDQLTRREVEEYIKAFRERRIEA